MDPTEGLSTAVKGFTDADPVLGGVIILLLIANGVTARFLLGIIKDLKADLVTERAEHQKTRTSQIEDLRNMGRMVTSLDALRDSLVSRKAS